MALRILEAGKLRHRIKIVTPQFIQDDIGGTHIDEQQLVAEVWGSVEPATGREVYSGQQEVSQVTHKITIRHPRANFRVTAQQNVCWFDGFNQRFFQIQDVQKPEGRFHYLYLLCIERSDSMRDQITGPGLP